jgi:hypothetical protein
MARKGSETKETREEGKQSNLLTVLDIRARKVLTSSYNIIFSTARG